jgi:putative flippase GtrA
VFEIREFIKNFFDVKFWKFILVGLLNTLIGEGLKFLLFNLCHTGVWVSSIIGMVIGSVVSYFLNKHFTFKNKEKGWQPILRFAINIAICFTLANGIALPIVEWICLTNSITMFGWTVETFAGNASMITASCLFVAFNYIGQRFFAFKIKENVSSNISIL